MGDKTTVTLHIDKEFLKIIDEEVYKTGNKNNTGRRFDRSAWIVSQIDYALKLQLGLAYRRFRK